VKTTQIKLENNLISIKLFNFNGYNLNLVDYWFSIHSSLVLSQEKVDTQKIFSCMSTFSLLMQARFFGVN